MNAENVHRERSEMEELRLSLERLREELGSCRWKERESEEKAANARLQLSILEQEVSAAKSDLALMEQTIEDLETSKIELSVALEYRIETLENEQFTMCQRHDAELDEIKRELTQAHHDKDLLTDRLEQSEKANAALVFSTTHEGLGGGESDSDLFKLQLERAQLLAKITEMGSDLERRVREAVAAQVSSSEAELIVEKQSRKSVETSLSDALVEMNDVQRHLAKSKAVLEERETKDDSIADLRSRLNEMRKANIDLKSEVKLMKSKLNTCNQDNSTLINSLKSKLHKAEESLRSQQRESRFEAALASEIAHLRASSVNNSVPNASILRGLDENRMPAARDDTKDSIERNSAYVVEMYDYVVELKHSIAEERRMYRDLLEEHEDLLALLGQAGLAGQSLEG